MRRKNRQDLSSLFLFLIICLFFVLAGVSIGFQPRIYEFSSDRDIYTQNAKEPIKLNWQVSFFSTDITLESPDHKYKVNPSGQMDFYPAASGKYILTASNWLSRFLGISHTKWIDIQVFSQPPDFTLAAKKQALNQYEISWSVDKSCTNPLLEIGDQQFPIGAEEFVGNRSIKIDSSTSVSLICQEGKIQKRKSVDLPFEEQEFRLKRFAVWLAAPGTSTALTNQASYNIKFAEMVPESPSSGYRLQKYPLNRSVYSGESVLIEWEIEGADSLMIDPVSKEVLPKKGASVLILKKSANIILNAVKGDKKFTYTIPVSVVPVILNAKATPTTVRYYGSASARTAVPSASNTTIQKPKAPVIDFFRVNPGTIKEPGKVILSWSVNGDWTRIQLLTSPMIYTDVGHAEHYTSQSGTTNVIDNLPPSGFLIYDIKGGTSFILRAWNGSSVDSASADIRFDAAANKKTATNIRIAELFPAASYYTVGDEVTVSVAVTEANTDKDVLSGSIVVTDGISYCQITLPRSSCEFSVRREGTYPIEAHYVGNSDFLASKTSLPIQSAQRTKENLQISADFLPETPPFYLNEHFIVSVDLLDSNGNAPDSAPSGTLFISDGFENCLVTLPRNSCSFSPKFVGNRSLTITYSGDDRFAQSSADFPITIAAKPTEKLSLSIEILKVYPIKGTYTIGDTVDIYIRTDGVKPELKPNEKIEISDGVATCLISFNADNHCSLRLISTSAKSIYAKYSGDEHYLPANAEPYMIQVEELPKQTSEITISDIVPLQAAYKIGDTLDISVSVTDIDSEEPITDGTVTISDGFSECTIDLVDQTTCRLTLVNGAARQITASFSGNEIYASAVSSPYPIKLVMAMINAAILPLLYSDCETTYPDTENEIHAYTDNSIQPPDEIFFLDDRFTLGNGLRIKAAVESLAGNFSADPGAISTVLCSINNPDYCIESGPQLLARDPNRFTVAAAEIDVPALNFAGNYTLTIRFEGDPMTLGNSERVFSVFKIHPGKIILAPAGVFNPDEIYSTYYWGGNQAVRLHEASYGFDAYLLRGDLLQCPVPIGPANYPSPGAASILVTVDASLPGSEMDDASWRNAFAANGFSEAAVSLLQPNQMVWDTNSCSWVGSGETWQLTCNDVGFNERSVIRYSLQQTDTNYSVIDLDLDGASDTSIFAELNRFLSTVKMPPEITAVQKGAPFWLNYFGASFGYWVVDVCPQDYLRGDLTMSSTIPSAQSVHFTPYALTRSLAGSDFLFQEISGTVSLSSHTNPEMITPLNEYHGICSSCNPKGMMKFSSIPNEGCILGNGNEIGIPATSGALYGGNRCETTEFGTESVKSSFCQISFEGSGDLIARYDGNDQFLPSETTKPISVSADSAAVIAQNSMNSALPTMSDREAAADLTQHQEPNDESSFLKQLNFSDLETETSSEMPAPGNNLPETETALSAPNEVENSESSAAIASAQEAEMSPTIQNEAVTENVMPIADAPKFDLIFDGFYTADGLNILSGLFPVGTEASIRFTVAPYIPAGDLRNLLLAAYEGGEIPCSVSGNTVLCAIPTACGQFSSGSCSGTHQLTVRFFGQGKESPEETLLIDYELEPLTMDLIFTEEALTGLEAIQNSIAEIQSEIELAAATPEEYKMSDTNRVTETVLPIEISLNGLSDQSFDPDLISLEIEFETGQELDPIPLELHSLDPLQNLISFQLNLMDIFQCSTENDLLRALAGISGIQKVRAIYWGNDSIQPAAAEIQYN